MIVMKKIFLFTLLILFFSSISHAENLTLQVPASALIDPHLSLEKEDEIRIIDQLIAQTLARIERERGLKELMVQFKRQRDAFELGNQSKAHALGLLRTARQIYERIIADHLEHLFAKDYLDELTFFSSIAGKTSIPKP
jgi:hypothetical protein